MPGTLHEKVALVTGGGSGIGRASALAFAREGAQVVVADVQREGGEATVDLIKKADGTATFVRADVSKAPEVAALIAQTVRIYGQLDCAHNNAGVEGGIVPLHEYAEDVWDQVLNVNLKGVWLSMKYEIPQMLAQGGGAIVNTASTNGLIGSGNGMVAYTASKHGVVGLTKEAALEYAQRGIRVNAVCPAATRTPMFQRAFGIGSDADLDERRRARFPMGRLGTPEEMAQTVVWLCSDAASFVTGHAMLVDGGLVAQ